MRVIRGPARAPGARAPLAAALTLALAGCTGRATIEEIGRPVRIDEPMPAIGGTTLAGDEVSPADYHGDVVLLNVWATWCGPCRLEQPVLQRLFERYGDAGVYFLGIDYRDDDAKARAWVEEFHVGYPSVVDHAGGFADDLGFLGLPATYLIDRGGRMRYRILGAAREEDLVAILAELLAGQPASSPSAATAANSNVR